MITDTKTVVSTLIVVLFLTMVVLSPNMLDLSYFCILFLLILKMR